MRYTSGLDSHPIIEHFVAIFVATFPGRNLKVLSKHGLLIRPIAKNLLEDFITLQRCVIRPLLLFDAILTSVEQIANQIFLAQADAEPFFVGAGDRRQ